MTYARTLKPIFFTDAVNAMKLNGEAKAGMITDRLGSYNSGYDKFDLFDLNPQNVTSFDTSAATTTHILIEIDLGTSGYDIDYCALLNHNLATAEGTIRITHAAGPISAAGGGTTVGDSSTPPVEVLNADTNPLSGAVLDETITAIETDWDVTDGSVFTVGEYALITNNDPATEVVAITGIAANTLTVVRAQQGTSALTFDSAFPLRKYNCISPDADGDTIATFASSSDRYWAIEIIPSDGAFSATDLTMGAFMIGEKYSLPLSPDMNISHPFDTSGVNISVSVSGKRHSSPRWIKANNITSGAGNYIPFRLGIGAKQIPGREGYSFNYSTLADTDLLPSDLGTPSGNSFVVNVMSKTGWNATPLIMGVDSTSTTQGDYMFCRFRENSFVITQMSAKAYSTAFSVDQEF